MKQEFRVGDPVISRCSALNSQASICVSKSLCLESTVREGCCHHKVAAAPSAPHFPEDLVVPPPGYSIAEFDTRLCLFFSLWATS